jgi:hypothetical protein
MRKVVYRYGDWVIELVPAGDILVRQCGGARFHIALGHTPERPTVSAWRARIPKARWPEIVASLEEARAVKDGASVALPDEQDSSISLSLGGLTLCARQSALGSNAPLSRVAAELAGVATALRAGPPTDTLPNPDPSNDVIFNNPFRPMGPDAPEPPPGASERAQAAVDRFYAESLDALLASVMARPRPAAAASPPRMEDVEYTFMCKQTSVPAGTVALRLGPGENELEVSDFATLTGVTMRLLPSDVSTVHRQLVAGDARSIWQRNEKLVPFYCPQCDACYAARLWKIFNTSPMRVEGTCPLEHRRRMRMG